MEEPVEKVSDRVTNLNSLEHQLMISSQIRVICIMRILEFDKNSRIKSDRKQHPRNCYMVLQSPLSQMSYYDQSGKLFLLVQRLTVERDIRMLDIKFKTFGITCKHVVISHQVVTKRNRLCMLQVGVAWHNCIGMFVC